jgi:hypothetical protein
VPNRDGEYLRNLRVALLDVTARSSAIVQCRFVFPVWIVAFLVVGVPILGAAITIATVRDPWGAAPAKPLGFVRVRGESSSGS